MTVGKKKWEHLKYNFVFLNKDVIIILIAIQLAKIDRDQDTRLEHGNRVVSETQTLKAHFELMNGETY